jgi:hypothetical protein
VSAADVGVHDDAVAGVQIVGHHEPRAALEKRKHADMRADPVGQALGPAGLGVGEVGGAEHPTKICAGRISPLCSSAIGAVLPE